jgi:hypothetical protein
VCWDRWTGSSGYLLRRCFPPVSPVPPALSSSSQPKREREMNSAPFFSFNRIVFKTIRHVSWSILEKKCWVNLFDRTQYSCRVGLAIVRRLWTRKRVSPGEYSLNCRAALGFWWTRHVHCVKCIRLRFPPPTLCCCPYVLMIYSDGSLPFLALISSCVSFTVACCEVSRAVL